MNINANTASYPAQTYNPANQYGTDYSYPAQTQSNAMPQDSYENTAPQAGFFKRTGDMIGEMFSDLSYNMKMGDTYRLVEREFLQVDVDGNGHLNMFEFTAATLNPFDYQHADRNYDGTVTKHEYAKYRKERLEMAFEQKDHNNDRHLNVAEVGSVGRIYLQNRDPRVDLNQDGFLNKREYVKAHLTLGVSIRDMLGF